MFRKGDEVLVSDNAEACCFAEDSGLVGVVTKVKRANFYTVKTAAGEWYHCDKCISLVNIKKVTASKRF
jgi:hypothetical protein